MNNQESGRSLVEMLGVVAIIGVLTLGVMSTVNFGIGSFRVSAVFNTVENAAQGISDLYSWKREFPSDNKAIRDKICDTRNKVFDEPCEASESEIATVKIPWGYLKVEADTTAQFKMTLTDVPYQACNQLLNMDWTNVKPNTTECSDDKTNIVFLGG